MVIIPLQVFLPTVLGVDLAATVILVLSKIILGFSFSFSFDVYHFIIQLKYNFDEWFF